MKQGSKLERDPQKLALQLEQLHELNSDQLREQWQTLFGADPPPKLVPRCWFRGLPIGFRRKPLGGSSLRLCGCSSESQTMPPHAGRSPSLPRKLA